MTETILAGAFASQILYPLLELRPANDQEETLIESNSGQRTQFEYWSGDGESFNISGGGNGVG